jgi:ketoreductase RED1
MADRPVAVVGAGLIGCSWAAYYAAQGLNVRVSDVRAGYEDAAAARIGSLAGELPGVDLENAMTRVAFFTSIEEAVEGVELV